MSALSKSRVIVILILNNMHKFFK